MATSHKLNAQTRTCTGKVNQLRAQGILPAVMYGEGAEATNLQIDSKEFSAMLAAAESEHIIVDLSIDGKEAVTTLLKDVQHNYLSRIVMHADFLKVSPTTEIHSTVPVVLTGEPVGVAQGGVLDQTLHALDIKCMSKDLPEHIVADITNLAVGQSLTVGDLNLDGSIVSKLSADTIIAIVEEPKVADEEEATEAPAEGEAPAAE